MSSSAVAPFPSGPPASPPPLLPSVCVVSIVKNEESNPAGGLEATMARILPYVRSAVVVDTGSTDGTMGVLRRLQQRYPHLHVYETTFESFAHARNYSFARALELQRSLDADRRAVLRAARDHRSESAAACADPQRRLAILTSPLPDPLPTFRHLLVLDADESMAPAALAMLAAVLKLDCHVDPQSWVPPSEAEVQAAERERERTRERSRENSSGPGSAHASARAHEAAESQLIGGAMTAALHDVATPLRHYPVCVKLSISCYDSSGHTAPRSNSGLWNPRVLSADARFSFVNLVDDYRFERLLFDGADIDPRCYVREGDLPLELQRHYEEIKAREDGAEELPRQEEDAEALAVAIQALQLEPSQQTQAPATQTNRVPSSPVSIGGAQSTQRKRLPSTLTLQADPPSLSNSYSLPHSASHSMQRSRSDSRSPDGGGQGGRNDAFSSSDSAFPPSCDGSSSSSSLPLCLPLRHHIPNLAGRRKKNAAYKAAGAVARARAAAAAGHAAPSSLRSPAYQQQQQQQQSSQSSGSVIRLSNTYVACSSPVLRGASSAVSPRSRSQSISSSGSRSRIFAPSSPSVY